MRYDTFKDLHKGKKGGIPCVIIKTGEEGTIIGIDKQRDTLLVKAHRHAMGIVEQTFYYNEIEVW